MSNDNKKWPATAASPPQRVPSSSPVSSDPQAISPEAVRKRDPGETVKPIVTRSAPATSKAPPQVHKQ